MPNENIYDKTFKKVMSETVEAVALAKTYFPKQLSDDLDYSTMQLLPTSMVDDQIQEHISDVIYACKMKSGEEVWLNFIFEHKSYLPKKPEIQLLKYLADGYSYQRQEDLPTTQIIPVILYHGKERWKRRKVSDYMQHEKEYLLPFVPNFDYVLIDLSKYSDDEIFAIELGFILRHILLLFKHKNEDEFLLRESKKVFIFENKNLTQEDINERNRLIFTFVIRAYNLKEEKMKQMLQEMPDTIITEGMTTYEQIRARIRWEAKKESYLEKRKNEVSFSLKFMLLLPTLSFAEIANHAETSPALVKKLSDSFKSGNIKKARKTTFESFKEFGELNEKEVKMIEEIVTKYYPKFQDLKK